MKYARLCTNYNPEQEQIHINAIQELLALALFELYKKQQNEKINERKENTYD